MSRWYAGAITIEFVDQRGVLYSRRVFVDLISGCELKRVVDADAADSNAI